MDGKVEALTEVARLPDPRDNVATATGRLEGGARIISESGSYRIASTVPEGHRFATRPITRGEVLRAYRLDEEVFTPGAQVELYSEPAKVVGSERPGGRGVGMRNYTAVLAASSRAASLARLLEEWLTGAADAHENLDGAVAASHTEGGESASPNELGLLLRTPARGAG